MQEKYLLEICDIEEINITKEKVKIIINSNLDKYSDFEYLYWDKIKYKEVPDGIKDNKELWGLIKFFRNLNYTSPVQTENGEAFRFGELPFSQELLHEIDKNASGVFFMPSDSQKKVFVANGMLEEAISSSQLEGASTTTQNATKMLKEERKPNTIDEQMIVNNYNAMMYIKNDLVKKELEESDILYLQSILTEGTLKKKDQVGRFRKDSDEVVVEFERKISHIPMSETALSLELKRLINFANNKGDFGTFVHPIIRAIIIHFWIGYLHPFCDGNGRTARALFYWYSLRNDYFGFSYIPLSTAIKNSKIEYAKSYIYSEQDDLDLTYFINYNLRKIKISLERFRDELKVKLKENDADLRNLSNLGLNERQIKLINYFLKNPESLTNYKIHANYYGITAPTAISDLKKLEKIGYIYSIRSGRSISYSPQENLEEIIKKDQN